VSSTWFRILCWAAALLALLPDGAVGQARGLELAYGRWWHDSAATIYSLAYYRSLIGPVDYGLGFTHIDETSSANAGRLSGADVSLSLWRDGSGPYAVAGAGLGMRHTDGNLDAHWSAGGGYALRALGILSVGLEARYRVEDRNARGFWRLDPADRRGITLLGRVSVGFGGGVRARPRPAPRPTPTYEPPSESDIARAAGDDGADGEAANLRALVVQTALDVMGTPYQWGGTDENGFDCSGLIQYAYGEHGLILPRVSRDQTGTGLRVDRSVDQLLPGDILGFSVERTRVTHVGLYVGDGLFIHSASGGVKLTSLLATDPDSRWWRDRWVVARRVVN
jgi:cell wall-associated NlpC family hydrolase